MLASRKKERSPLGPLENTSDAGLALERPRFVSARASALLGLASASRTELGQVAASASGRSCLRGDRSIGAGLSRCDWFVVDGVEDDFSLIGKDFLVSERGVVHGEYAACTGEIFCAAGNGVDALAFDGPARLGLVLDPEQVVETQIARGVARVAAAIVVAVQASDELPAAGLDDPPLRLRLVVAGRQCLGAQNDPPTQQITAHAVHPPIAVNGDVAATDRNDGRSVIVGSFAWMGSCRADGSVNTRGSAARPMAVRRGAPPRRFDGCGAE